MLHVFVPQEAKFPRDFGVDTLAGVMGVDPPSFGGRGRGRGGGSGRGGDEKERKEVMAFLERWKAFDWTSELDGEFFCFFSFFGEWIGGFSRQIS